MAIIGHTGKGNFGHGLDRVWLDIPNTEVVGMSDGNPKGLAKAKKPFEKAKGFTDYQEMLEETKPDLVAVAPRWLDQHCDMVIAAANSGVKGIYLEKPMAQDLEQCDRMIAACEKHGTKLAIATQTRYSPQARLVKKMIDEGGLGRIVEIRARGKDDRRGGGEDLWVLGTHVLDLMQYFGGEAQTCFANVYLKGKPIVAADIKPGPVGIGPLAGDEVHAQYRLANGVTGYFDSVRNTQSKPSRYGIHVYGSKGAVSLYDVGSLPQTWFLPAANWSNDRLKKDWIPVSSNGVGKSETIEKGGLHEGNVLAINDLIDSIESDHQPVASIYEARKTVEMIASVFESQRLGKSVSLPLENRKNPLTLLK